MNAYMIIIAALAILCVALTVYLLLLKCNIRNMTGELARTKEADYNRISDGQAPDVDHIFDRTYRADKARSDGSAGLGLAIVKLLMEKMGGEITADIEDNNLIFTISFAK